jgi:hypothetical protein
MDAIDLLTVRQGISKNRLEDLGSRMSKTKQADAG